MAHYRIRVVEDSSNFGRVLELLLRRVGHDCRICRDAKSALVTLEEYQPHAVILDVGLPGASGLELARQLRARAEGSRMAVVGCSGYAFFDDRQRGLEAGMDIYFTKPVIAGELVKTVLALVERKGRSILATGRPRKWPVECDWPRFFCRSPITAQRLTNYGLRGRRKNPASARTGLRQQRSGLPRTAAGKI